MAWLSAIFAFQECRAETRSWLLCLSLEWPSNTGRSPADKHRDPLSTQFHPLSFPLSGHLTPETGGLNRDAHNTSHLAHHIFTTVGTVLLLTATLEMWKHSTRIRSTFCHACCSTRTITQPERMTFRLLFSICLIYFWLGYCVINLQ